MKAAFLIRCSTTQQDYDRQIDDLTKVANSYKFETSPDLFFGEYITGKDDTTKKDRKSIELMKEAAKAHKFDVLLVVICLKIRTFVVATTTHYMQDSGYQHDIALLEEN